MKRPVFEQPLDSDSQEEAMTKVVSYFQGVMDYVDYKMRSSVKKAVKKQVRNRPGKKPGRKKRKKWNYFE